ncbi:MAG: hypothetical protein N4A35_00745 [Flavobacteriales bacterium]|jgi:hypothetical protein|nr:hypothetical protein [Flavobacteriales bacterium]
MKKSKSFKLLFLLTIVFYSSCAQQEQSLEEKINQVVPQVNKKLEPHRYGGWYCPDNLNQFPAVDIESWRGVPVVNGRFANEEEFEKGASLIDVDLEKYPEAKVLPIQLPQLAKFYNRYSKREDLVIVIQAFSVQEDSIVGFRYLNGGNGSARLSDVKILSEVELLAIPSSKFIAVDVQIDEGQQRVWEVLTQDQYAKELFAVLGVKNNQKELGVNFKYESAGKVASAYGDKLFGNYYIQNDFEKMNYTEKFFLLEDETKQSTVLKIVCGPFIEGASLQKDKIEKWSKKVKELSELK